MDNRGTRDQSFVVLRRHRPLVAAMTLGSVAGTVVGGLLLGIVPDVVLVPGLTLLLLLSAIKVCRHRNAPGPVPDGMVPILEPEDPAGGSV